MRSYQISFSLFFSVIITFALMISISNLNKKNDIPLPPKRYVVLKAETIKIKKKEEIKNTKKQLKQKNERKNSISKTPVVKETTIKPKIIEKKEPKPIVKKSEPKKEVKPLPVKKIIEKKIVKKEKPEIKKEPVKPIKNVVIKKIPEIKEDIVKEEIIEEKIIEEKKPEEIIIPKTVVKKESEIIKTTLQPIKENTVAVDNIKTDSNSTEDIILDNLDKDGVEYKILKQFSPSYPEMAKKFGLKMEVTVVAKILIGLDGHIESIDIIKGLEDFGFNAEVRNSIKHWRFSPIKYNGKIVKAYYIKPFKFVRK